jgi:hypothetical protein
MSIVLKHRRGLEAALPVLAEAEFWFSKDTYKLFIGSAAGNQEIHFGRQIIGGDSVKSNLGVGLNALGSVLAGITQQDTVIGVGALPSDQWVGLNTVVGSEALKSLTTGYMNDIFGVKAGESITTGTTNTLIGGSAGGYLIDGSWNVVVGQNAFHSDHGNYNTIIGWSAQHAHGGDGNVIIGCKAGYYETGSNKFFIDNAQRADEADGRIKALLYGVFDALTANQRLSINARLLVRECPNYANNAAAVAAGLTSGELYTVTGTDPLQVARVI